jgi:hypothetical protein
MSLHNKEVSYLSALLLAARSDQRPMDTALLLLSGKHYGQLKKTTTLPFGWLSRLSSVIGEGSGRVSMSDFVGPKTCASAVIVLLSDRISRV